MKQGSKPTGKDVAAILDRLKRKQPHIPDGRPKTTTPAEPAGMPPEQPRMPAGTPEGSERMETAPPPTKPLGTAPGASGEQSMASLQAKTTAAAKDSLNRIGGVLLMAWGVAERVAKVVQAEHGQDLPVEVVERLAVDIAIGYQHLGGAYLVLGVPDQVAMTNLQREQG